MPGDWLLELVKLGGRRDLAPGLDDRRLHRPQAGGQLAGGAHSACQAGSELSRPIRELAEPDLKRAGAGGELGQAVVSWLPPSAAARSGRPAARCRRAAA